MPTKSAKAHARRESTRRRLAGQLVGPVEALLREGHGFTDLSVEEIIQRAGVPRSTFYYHFADKGELLIAISETAMEEIVEASHGLYRVGPDEGREAFTEAVRHTVETWLPHVPLMNALAEVASYNPRVKEQFLAGWAAAQRGAADHIRDGQRSGAVRPDLHPEHTAAWLTWMAERGMSQIVVPAAPRRVTEIVDSLAAIVWLTLYPDEQNLR